MEARKTESETKKKGTPVRMPFFATISFEA